MSKQQIVDSLFAPLDEPKSSGNEWCPLSEARLLQLVLKYRPIGINKHINMDLIVMYMKHIYAKEDGVNIFLNDADLQEYAAGLELPPDERVARFEPSYSIRPTADQIWEKINALYDTNSLEFREMIALPLPPELTTASDFELPKSYFTDIQIRLRSLRSQIGIFDSDTPVDTADPTTSQGVSLAVPSHGNTEQSVLNEASSGPCEPVFEISGPKEWISGPSSQGLIGLDSTPELSSSLQDDPHVPLIKEEPSFESMQEPTLPGQHVEETPKMSLQRISPIPLVEKLMSDFTLESSPSKTSLHVGNVLSSSSAPDENSVLKVPSLELAEEENNPPSLTRKPRRRSRTGESKTILKRKRGLKEKQNRK
ncbi:unnamed protein product [Haemonchus placei]|uniref:MRG domain-containing protein n=1 Tax=Haemonchus placei TaxID=6290 RepID=A0A0N4WX60_HAEPC|nr:unnamed protein product [Haemonchus placei]